MLEGKQQKLFADIGIHKAYATRIPRVRSSENPLGIASRKLRIRQREHGRNGLVGKTD
jgi:hypothetical protein